MAQNGLPGPDRELDGWIWSNVEAETDGKVLKEKKGEIPWGESLSVTSLSSTDNNPIKTANTRVA